jgi:hypothetical protein
MVLHAAFPSTAAAGPFKFGRITESIVSATFTVDFAALTAHRFIGGVEVNGVKLLGTGGTALDLSADLFGSADLLRDPPLLDQGVLRTGIVAASVPLWFFPQLATGRVGIDAVFTDTFDALFAMDFISLRIVTVTRTIEAFMDSNNGFGIGLPDGGVLPTPLPTSIPAGATGVGFDETISSKSIHTDVNEPLTMMLLGVGLTGVGVCHRFSRRKPNIRRGDITGNGDGK